MDWVAWVPMIVLIVGGLATFALRNSIRTWIEAGIRYRYDQKIEELRSDFRNREAALESERNSRQSEIAALRDAVLSGSASRRALVDKRRMDAVERLWEAAIELQRYSFVVYPVTALSSAEESASNLQLQPFWKVLSGNWPNANGPDGWAPLKERPFVSPLAWALFTAYQTIVHSAVVKLKGWELGLKNVGDMLDSKLPLGLLKSALPDRAEYIDKVGQAAFPHLLEELQNAFLFELTKMLDGTVADRESVGRSAAILKEAAKAADDLRAAQRKVDEASESASN